MQFIDAIFILCVSVSYIYEQAAPHTPTQLSHIIIYVYMYGGFLANKIQNFSHLKEKVWCAPYYTRLFGI